MPDIFEELKRYLEWYRTIYSSNLIADNLVVDTSQPRHSEEGPRAKKPQTAFDGSRNEPWTEDLRQFYIDIRECQKCPLGATRKRFVFGSGNSKADIMFIGEAPGKEEDEQGKPFVGRAGQLLTRMLQAIGLEREEVFIANVLKCRPPHNRDPLPEEVEQCQPYLKEQLRLIDPILLVALGRVAAQVLLEKPGTALSDLRRTFHQYQERPLMVTYHPAALLRNPMLKKRTWEDLKRIRAYFRNPS